jgi:farnesyl-diphosphate farnesyltransferase
MGLAGEAFLEESNRVKSQQLMEKIIIRAKTHLDNALCYSCAIPRQAIRARIFCFLPLFMAAKTIAKAIHSEQLFDVNNPVKISRQEVKNIVLYTYMNCWSNHRMRKWYDKVTCVFDEI